MDLTDIRKLVRLMIRAELSELEIDDSNKGLRVHLKRRAGDEASAAAPPLVQWMAPGMAAPSAPERSGASEATAPAGRDGGSDSLPEGAEAIRSPMVGTFYRAASPEAEPFVSVGSQVNEDSVLCIIEAMKVMNEIKAEMRGEILEVLAENGDPVEFGQPLFVIRKA